jgi:hypothetical protein
LRDVIDDISNVWSRLPRRAILPFQSGVRHSTYCDEPGSNALAENLRK